jgi:hypothetical protein
MRNAIALLISIRYSDGGPKPSAAQNIRGALKSTSDVLGTAISKKPGFSTGCKNTRNRVSARGVFLFL